MTLSKSIRSRLLASIFLAGVVAISGWYLLIGDGSLNTSIQRASYDSLHSFSGVSHVAVKDSPVVVVYLDLDSYAKRNLDPAKPWPRELHAELLRRIKAAQSKAVVFDIVFNFASDNADADAALVDSVRGCGNVILAAEYNDKSSVATDGEHVGAKLGFVGKVYEPLAHAAAGVGVASLGIDDDRVARRFVAGFTTSEKPSLTWAAATFLRLPVTQKPSAMGDANQSWIRYYGPPLTVPHVSYSQALAPDGVKDEFFRGKVVFIGGRPSLGAFNDRQDEFGSPFHSWANKDLFLPGVEVHATQMLNLLRNENLQRLATGKTCLILLLVAFLFGGGLIWLRPVPATFAAIAGVGATLCLARIGFDLGVWFSWMIVAAAQIPIALGCSVLFRSIEWYREKKRFEAAKKIADAKIREQAALIDKAHDAILVQALDGKILYANPSAERLYGWRLDELQSDEMRNELFSSDTASARDSVINEGEWNGELCQRNKSGALVIVASRWTLIRDERGQPKELLLINSDITEQKNLEQQFLRTQRMNTIGTLAGGMAHDLNNALAPILMGAQLLRRKATDPESRELLGMMEASTHRGADMVRQVLLFARGRGGEFEPVEPGALVRELEKMVRETFPNSIGVETFLPKDLWLVRGNPTQLHQVLLNLCVNARDAMPGGGKLSFVADNVELSTSEAAEIPDGTAGKFVSLAVSDTGAGMSPEVRAKIFEPFFSTKGEGLGTGIGLATVMRIVKAHSGFLRVESELNQGATFEVFLPQANIAAPTAVVRPIQELPRGNGEMILVADDEQAIRELMKSELVTFGYRVKTAANGAEAVAMFRLHQAEVRLLITDNAMPVMDGRQAIAEIRTLRPGLPVIYTSGGSAEKLEGVTELVKPFPLEELLVAIQHSLGTKSS